MTLTQHFHDWLGTILQTAPSERPNRVKRTMGRFRIGAAVLLRNFVDILLRWQERVQSRRQLTMMDSHMLNDIGVTRAEVDAEVRKPFWRN